MLAPSIHMLVVTESGKELGKVADIVWDVDSYLVVQLKVKRSLVDRAPLMVHTSQVVRVEKDKIVVSDMVLKLMDDKTVRVPRMVKGQAAFSQRKIE